MIGGFQVQTRPRRKSKLEGEVGLSVGRQPRLPLTLSSIPTAIHASLRLWLTRCITTDLWVSLSRGRLLRPASADLFLSHVGNTINKHHNYFKPVLMRQASSTVLKACMDANATLTLTRAEPILWMWRFRARAARISFSCCAVSHPPVSVFSLLRMTGCNYAVIKMPTLQQIRSRAVRRFSAVITPPLTRLRFLALWITKLCC